MSFKLGPKPYKPKKKKKLENIFTGFEVIQVVSECSTVLYKLTTYKR